MSLLWLLHNKLNDDCFHTGETVQAKQWAPTCNGSADKELMVHFQEPLITEKSIHYWWLIHKILATKSPISHFQSVEEGWISYLMLCQRSNFLSSCSLITIRSCLRATIASTMSELMPGEFSQSDAWIWRRSISPFEVGLMHLLSPNRKGKRHRSRGNFVSDFAVIKTIR